MEEVIENKSDNVEQVIPVKKKRGRKPKSYYENLEKNEEDIVKDKVPHVPKKRGRKPKGGKIVTTITNINSNNYVKQNVILHLKCKISDIDKIDDSNVEPTDSLLLNKTNELNYHIIEDNKEETNYYIKDNMVPENQESVNDILDKTPIWKKLKDLQKQLHNNDISDKKSACFWCTYDFDNPSIYIPKFKIRDSYHVYGCFCSPECGLSYLMNENIDTSVKMERYQLLNFIYGKIYEYKKNIKPAPNPYYLLDKYYGNLNIQEYRNLLTNDRLLLIVDKPLTRILPELHEENNDFLLNNNTNVSSSSFQIKKKTKKNNSKNDIVNEKFGNSIN